MSGCRNVKFLIGDPVITRPENLGMKPPTLQSLKDCKE
jgi:hypothetical protein